MIAHVILVQARIADVVVVVIVNVASSVPVLMFCKHAELQEHLFFLPEKFLQTNLCKNSLLFLLS